MLCLSGKRGGKKGHGGLQKHPAYSAGEVERELEAIEIPYTEKDGEGSVVGYINPDKEGFLMMYETLEFH